MPSRLVDLEVLEVSLVDKAANKRKFLLLKSQDSNLNHEQHGELFMSETQEKKGDIAMDSDNALVKEHAKEPETSAKSAEGNAESEKVVNRTPEDVLKGIAELVKNFEGKLPDDFMEKVAEVSGLDRKEPTQKSANDLIGNLPEDVRSQIDAVFKSQKDEINKMQDELASAQKVIFDKHEQEKTREFIAKAQTLDKLPIKFDEFGPVLKEVSESVSDKAFAEIERVLKEANDQVSLIFKETGTSVQDNQSDAYGELKLKAAEIAKSEGIKEAQAFSVACDRHPEVLKRYKEERRKRAN